MPIDATVLRTAMYLQQLVHYLINNNETGHSILAEIRLRYDLKILADTLENVAFVRLQIVCQLPKEALFSETGFDVFIDILVPNVERRSTKEGQADRPRDRWLRLGRDRLPASEVWGRGSPSQKNTPFYDFIIKL